MSSHKPFFWALFAAGGTLAALLAPIMILITGPAVALGWMSPEALSFERVSNGLTSLPIAILALVTLSLFLWHAAHRLRVTAHDLGWFSDSVAMLVFYGLATLGTAAAIALLT